MKKPPTNAEKFQEVFNMEPRDMILLHGMPYDDWWDESWNGSNKDQEYDEDREHHEFMKKYGGIMEWTDEPRYRYVNNPEYDEDREYNDFMKKYGQIMEQLKSYKIPEARAALIITQVLSIYEGCEEKEK